MTNEVNTRYTERVEECIAYLPSLEERKRIIEEINDDYLKETGETLPSHLLEMLGTWLLQEVYSDSRSNKVALEEYPVLTEHQIYRRKRKRVLIEDEAVLDALKYHISNNSSTASNKTSASLRG